MCELDLASQVLYVVGAVSDVKQVVSKGSGTAFASCGDNVPGVYKKSNPHHAERAPLGDSAAAFMCFSKTGGKGVVYEKFFLESGVSVDEE